MISLFFPLEKIVQVCDHLSNCCLECEVMHYVVNLHGDLYVGFMFGDEDDDSIKDFLDLVDHDDIPRYVYSEICTEERYPD